MTLLPLLLVPPLLAGPVADRLSVDRQLVWAGIDIRALQLYVPERFADPAEKVFWGPGGGLDDFVGSFDTPEDAWKRLCSDWNTMFVNERVPDLETRLELRVLVSTPELCATVQRPADAWFLPEYEAAANPATFDAVQLQAAVNSWPVPAQEGLALMVVAERYAKAEDEGCVWPVFFDIDSRQILHAERQCVAPRGIGFRNYWLNPVVDAIKATARTLSKGGV
jgi:hypothetical protein